MKEYFYKLVHYLSQESDQTTSLFGTEIICLNRESTETQILNN